MGGTQNENGVALEIFRREGCMYRCRRIAGRTQYALPVVEVTQPSKTVQGGVLSHHPSVVVLYGTIIRSMHTYLVRYLEHTAG